MNKLAHYSGAVVILMALVGSSATAATRYDQRHHARYGYNARSHHSYSGCEARRRHVANNGTLIGAVAGGLIGNQMAGSGSRGLGTVLGVGGGAVVGHQIAKSSHPC